MVRRDPRSSLVPVMIRPGVAGSAFAGDIWWGLRMVFGLVVIAIDTATLCKAGRRFRELMPMIADRPAAGFPQRQPLQPKYLVQLPRIFDRQTTLPLHISLVLPTGGINMATALPSVRVR